MNFLDQDNVGDVPRTSNAFASVAVWLEEAIFGHRLWYRQTPWLIFLEFMNVAEAFSREGTLLEGTEPVRSYPYNLRFRMGLRNILFNNEAIATIASERREDHDAWTAWLAFMSEASDGVAEDFGYVRDRFDRFSDFAELVALVRQTTIEAGSNRRWSSRFIFPFGVNALFCDAIMERGQPKRDYTVFGRTGELVYLMLSRSELAPELRRRFAAMFDPDHPKNRLVGLLAAPGDDRASREEHGDAFLPYRRHPAFERLAEDWVALLGLGLPEQDVFAHLVPLATLHVMLYQLETAAAVAGKERPRVVCEMITPRRGLVRQNAIASYYGNDSLVRQALTERRRALLAARFPAGLIEGEDDEEGELLTAVRGFLKSTFSFEPTQQPETVERLLQSFERAIETKLDQNGGQVHHYFGRYVGLISRRATNRYRYAPTDALLKTLVLARVPGRLEFGKFLQELDDHYGIVIGPEQAERALDPDSYDASSFERNRERLEGRLVSMGLLKRLSDGCAYVVNPFAREGRP